MPTANELIRDGNIRHIHWLERYKSGLVKQIITLLNKADGDLQETIAARLSRIEGRGYALSKDETKRLEDLLDEIRANRLSVSSLLYEETKAHLNDLVVHETEFHSGLIENSARTAGATINMKAPSLSQLKAVVSSRPFQGRLLKEWYKETAGASGAKITDAIKIGIIEGRTTDQIVRKIIGTKVNRYKDGILEASRRDVEAVVRTATAHVANNGAQELYAANDDIIDGVMWVSTLDSHTTIICASRDGKIYAIGNVPMIPAHWRCRSTTIPYLGEIIGMRASAMGAVPANTNYSDWLKTQPQKVQDQVLGTTRAKLFRNGIPMSRFVDTTGETYTLRELKKRDAEFWQNI